MAPSIEASARDRTIRLLEYDSDLGNGLRAERRQEARHSALARMLVVSRGPWDLPRLDAARGCSYGVLVLEGLVTRTAMLGGEDASAQLLGHGDLIRPARDHDDALVPVEVRWTVLEPLKVALLDEHFLLTVRRWPEIVAALFERVAAQSVRLGTHRALCQLARVEDRLHALMWFLAERWGRVTPQGVILPLKLTHELLGQLVGAKRPTVSLAIKELEGRGTVHRRSDGAWLLEQRWVRPGVADGLVVQVSAGFVASALAPVEPGAPADSGNGAVPPTHPTEAPATPEGPALVSVRPPSFAEMGHRVQRMRERHERSVSEVGALLARCADSQRRSIALRDRIARTRRDA